MPGEESKHRSRARRSGGIAGLILAGGRARRMGGADKPFVELAGRPLVAHVIARVRPQVAWLAVGAAGDTSRFSAIGLPVIADSVGDGGVEPFAGPLAGLLAGLEWAASGPIAAEWLAVFPADTPFLPTDFVARALAALAGEGAEVACAESGGRLHPVVSLWPVSLAGCVREAVVGEGLRRADRLLQRFAVGHVAYEGGLADPFFNVNTAEDLAEAERRLPSLTPATGR